MAGSKGHGRGGKGAGRDVGDKPAILVTRTERIEHFLYEYGRIVVPLVVFGTLAVLFYAGVISAIALGYAIGLVLLLTMPVAVAIIVLRGYFPMWARVATIVFTAVYLFGSVWPFTNMVYPGVPEFSQNLTQEMGQAKLPRDIRGGYYWVEVFAKSFSEVAGVANERGRYSVLLMKNDPKSGQRVQGEFSDQGLASAAGTYDGTTLSRTKALKLDPGPLTLWATRVEKQVGPEVRVSGFRMAASPFVFFVLLGLVLLWAVFVDAWFQSQTWRWRLAPWVGVSLVYLTFFYKTWEPARMPATSAWAAVVGGLGGFLLGWLLSLIARKIVGKVRTRI